MPITQVIDPLPSPPNPATDDSPTFAAKASIFTQAQVAMGPQLNTFAAQANALEQELNAIEAGYVYGLRYTWSTATTASDPGTGTVKINSAALASATALYLSELDYSAVSQALTIQAWDDATQTIKGTLRVIKATDSTKFAEYRVTGSITDNGAWDTLNITHLNSNGTFANGDLVVLYFERYGADGQDATFTTPVRTITGNASVTSADNGYMLDVTANSVTLTCDTPAALGNGTMFTLLGSAFAVTVAATYSDGATTKTFPAGSTVLFVCNGATVRAELLAAQEITAVRGLTGNNTSTSNFDLAAEAVTFRNSLGNAITRYATGTLTCSLGTAGPAINGRDQSAVFPANSWVYLYFITNGNTIATLASLTAPSAFTGATLPAGYTHWCYATTVRWNASSVLGNCYVRGKTVFYRDELSIMAGGTATSVTAVSLSPFTPPNALTTRLNGILYNASAAAGPYNATLRLLATSADWYRWCIGVETSGGNARDTGSVEIPNISQTVYYFMDSSATALILSCAGYTIPNGDS